MIKSIKLNANIAFKDVVSINFAAIGGVKAIIDC